MLIGSYRDASPVFQFDFELKDEPAGVAVDITTVEPRQLASVPSVSDFSSDCITALGKESSNVIRGIQKPMCIAGPSRLQQVVADRAAVDLNFINAKSADVQT